MIPKKCDLQDKYKLQVILTGECEAWNGYFPCCKKCSYLTIIPGTYYDKEWKKVFEVK